MQGLSVVDRLRLIARSKIKAPLERRFGAPLRRLRNAGRTFSPVFVAGASGSGTSFLAVSLGQRIQCAGVVYEIDTQVSPDSFLFVPSPDTFPSVAAYLDALAARETWPVEAGREEFLSIFRTCANAAGDTIVAKGPDINLTRTAFLARCFPNAHFVLVFRDPVANIEGLRRKWPVFGNDTLEEAIRFWSETHSKFAEDAEAISDRVTFVEYEKLVLQPDATLDAIASRCGLAPSTEGRKLESRPNQAGKGLRNVRNSEVGVVKDATQEAIDRMDPAETTAIRAALSPLHERLRAAAINR